MSDIREFVLSEPLFDNHEHQNGFTALERQKQKLDFGAFGGYVGADLACACVGAAPEPSDPDAYFRAWQFVRTAGYGQATEMACRELLGLEFTRENVDRINQALGEFAAPRTGRQIFETVFEKAGIRWAVCDCCWDSPTRLDFFSGSEHPAYFGQALRYDGVIGLTSREQVSRFERAMDASIQRLDDIDRALDAYAEKARRAGKLVAFKCGMAYLGTLRFSNSDRTTAEAVFEGIMQGRPTDARPLTEYLFHRFVQRARDFALPVQIHTGYLAGNWGDAGQGDPAPLAEVFKRYRNVKFDVFHASWPFSNVLCALAKAFPNVYPDMCWAWSMNPAAMERTLDEWLAAVPHNKIFAFGGDTGAPWPALGYAMQARRGIANVLERKVQRGEYDEATARSVASRIMHLNAQEFYGM